MGCVLLEYSLGNNPSPPALTALNTLCNLYILLQPYVTPSERLVLGIPLVVGALNLLSYERRYTGRIYLLDDELYEPLMDDNESSAITDLLGYLENV